jgi:hypothetical protein
VEVTPIGRDFEEGLPVGEVPRLDEANLLAVRRPAWIVIVVVPLGQPANVGSVDFGRVDRPALPNLVRPWHDEGKPVAIRRPLGLLGLDPELDDLPAAAIRVDGPNPVGSERVDQPSP